jgi:hypothetical protein
LPFCRLSVKWKSRLAISRTWFRILSRRPKQNFELWMDLTGLPISSLNPFTHEENWNTKDTSHPESMEFYITVSDTKLLSCLHLIHYYHYTDSKSIHYIWEIALAYRRTWFWKRDQYIQVWWLYAIQNMPCL